MSDSVDITLCMLLVKIRGLIIKPKLILTLLSLLALIHE